MDTDTQPGPAKAAGALEGSAVLDELRRRPEETAHDSLASILPTLQEFTREVVEEVAKLDEKLQPVQRKDPVDIVSQAMPGVTESASPVVQVLAQDVLEPLAVALQRLRQVRARVDTF